MAEHQQVTLINHPVVVQVQFDPGQLSAGHLTDFARGALIEAATEVCGNQVRDLLRAVLVNVQRSALWTLHFMVAKLAGKLLGIGQGAFLRHALKHAFRGRVGGKRGIAAKQDGKDAEKEDVLN